MNINAFISKLNSLESKAKIVVNKTIIKEAPEANREQLEQGLNADGEAITKQTIRAGATTYSKGYAKLRKRKGLQTKYIDAKFTGKYHNSIKAKRKGKDYKLDATDPKANKVEENLGNLVGLNEKAVIEVEKALEFNLEALMVKELA